MYNNMRYMDKPLLIVSMLLIIYGLFNIVTASSREAVSIDAPLFYYFFRHGQMLLIGLFLGLIILNTDSKYYKFISKLLYIIIGACLVILYVKGTANRGAKNWLYVGPFSFQPSELAKPILIVVLALLYEYYSRFFKDKKQNHYTVIGKITFIGILFAVIILLSKDFGTMFIILCIFAALFYGSNILKIEKFKLTMYAVIIVVVGLLGLKLTGKHLLSEAQMARFDYFNPCQKYETTGYQICNSFIAINNGGLLGLGIGKSKQKYSYIPEPHTDSIFAIIAEEYGLIFCFFIFVSYFIILWRIVVISSRASTLRGRYIALGVAVYLFSHIFVNLGGLFGVIPLTGVPLPFLSYGGSFLISAICSLCLVQRVCIETRQKNNKD